MNCRACTRKTLGLFVHSLFNTESLLLPRASSNRASQWSRSFSHARRLQTSEPAAPAPAKPTGPKNPKDDKPTTKTNASATEKPAWKVQKAALKEKLGGEAWNPRKKLSPDTMEGIRHLHKSQPQKFTTPVLAQHFKVSPEAIRRILKSKWRPSDAEHDDRLRRWDKRGERIWSNLVEMGVKPPKKWRDMGVGRAEGKGAKPKWKTGKRNTVVVRDSVDLYEEESIIPVVEGKFDPDSEPRGPTIPLWGRV